VSLGDIQKLVREIIHLHGEDFDLLDEVIVRHESGNRGGETNRCGDEGLRDARRYSLLEEWVTLRPRKAFMMPQTVPNSPINGAALAVVAKKVKYFSSLVISTLVARFMARETFSTPPNSVVRFSPGEFSFFVRETRTSSSYPDRKT
jgi:hypothetical protein